MNDLEQFIEMSHYAGMREDLIQAGGGNTSVKLDQNQMLIKASGYQLSDLVLEEGYTTIDYQIITNYFENTSICEITKESEKYILDKALLKGLRPSIETFLHAITNKFTLHSHPTIVNAITSRSNGMQLLKELFPQALMIDYATPGIDLAKKYFEIYIENKKNSDICFDLIFLKNHGLIVSGANAMEVINRNERVVKKIAEYLHYDMERYQNVTKLYSALRDCGITNDIVYLSNDINIYKALESLERKKWNHCFCPDCVVYCGREILSLSDDLNNQLIKEYLNLYGKPVIVEYKNNIYIVASSVKKAKEIESVFSFSMQVLLMNAEYRMDLLSEKEKDFLINWDAEKYRKNMK